MQQPTSPVAGEAVPERADHEIGMQLTWLPTETLAAHFTGRSPVFDGPVGCIYRVAEQPEQWAWGMVADDHEISRNCGPTSGVERSARRAATEVERAWLAAIRGTSHDRPAALAATRRNSYAEAKQRVGDGERGRHAA